MTDFEQCSLMVQALAAAATFLAVVVALWNEPIRQRLSRPKLQLLLDEPVLTPLTGGQHGWYYMLVVHNERPSCPAVNVRVLLTSIRKKGPDGVWREIKFSGPVQVMWRWPAFMPQYATIGGADERVTFLEARSDLSQPSLRLYVHPNNLPGTISPGEHVQFGFEAVSDTAKSAPVHVDVAWTGGWFEGRNEMSEGLIVKVNLPEFKFESQHTAFLSDFLRSCIAFLRGFVAEPLARP